MNLSLTKINFSYNYEDGAKNSGIEKWVGQKKVFFLSGYCLVPHGV